MLMCLPGQLYSIPEPAKQGLVATECVCRTVQTNTLEEDNLMGIKMKKTFRNAGHWLNKQHVMVVCLLSVLHIGLSLIHTRASGTADLGQAMKKI